MLALAFLAAFAAASDDPTYAQGASLPDWVRDALNGQQLRYRACTCLNPFYQRGDFDGDGTADYAITVKAIASQKSGVLIVHSKDRSTRVLGAGIDFGNGGDDFSWIDAWHVEDRQGAQREALILEKTESASGRARWDGKKYRWEQLGD